jgi:hypothetical protein
MVWECEDIAKALSTLRNAAVFVIGLKDCGDV